MLKKSKRSLRTLSMTCWFVYGKFTDLTDLYVCMLLFWFGELVGLQNKKYGVSKIMQLITLALLYPNQITWFPLFLTDRFHCFFLAFVPIFQYFFSALFNDSLYRAIKIPHKLTWLELSGRF